MSANNMGKTRLEFHLSPELHRKLQLRAGTGSESLSEIVEQALTFCLTNLDENKASDDHTLQVLAYLEDDKVFQIAPNDYKAWYCRGMALSSIGRYEEAIASFDATLKVKPDYKKAWYNRGCAFYEIDFYEEAIKSYDKALEIESEDYAAWYNRGNALSNLGCYEKAISSYDRALEIQPSCDQTLSARGDALYYLSRYQEEISSYDKVLEIKPKDRHAAHNRSIAQQQLARHEDAHKVTSDKQKVTLYIPPGLHRQLKIRAAIDTESMSAMVEKAIAFYLKYPEKVEAVEASHGKTHQVHICPECDAAMEMREGRMVSLKNQPSAISEELPIEVREPVKIQANSQGEEKLYPI